MSNSDSGTLLSRLSYQPKALQFGTSGRRGELTHLTQLELYLNALAELKYLQTLATAHGGISPGDDFYFAYDLRPSSTAFASEYSGRGELAQAVVRAILDAGLHPVNLGAIPTPALTYFALRQHKGSIMVTGSHIPFDRNGYKLNTSSGELLKEHERPIQQAVEEERQRLYNEPFAASLFDARGMFKDGHCALPPVVDTAREAYLQRYLDFFSGQSLAGMRLLVYQHSSAARDLLVEVLQKLGAETIPAGRSAEFVPIDTENIDTEQLAAIQRLADAHAGSIDAIVSTDGDGDRPLILGLDGKTVHFFPGDLVGMIVAEYLDADAVVVPITCNDAIDRGSLASRLQPKTRIGSPFVIARMEEASAGGFRRVCGWEANGGFLLGSDIQRSGDGAGALRALPTRDAFLPILCTLFSARRQGLTLPQLFARVSVRFSRAGLLRNFPRAVALGILSKFTPSNAAGKEYLLADDGGAEAKAIADRLSEFFTSGHGFGKIVKLNYLDGLRMTFDTGDVAHLRPSGNADELRIYAVADCQQRANQIVAAALAEPDGILRQLERACG